jgi:hypothetical protein
MATTTADAVRVMRDAVATAQTDVDDTPKGCDTRPALERYAADLRSVLALLETNVLVPVAVAEAVLPLVDYLVFINQPADSLESETNRRRTQERHDKWQALATSLRGKP